MAEWRGLGTGQVSFGPPGESIIRINKNVTPEQRRARETRRKIEQLEERRRQASARAFGSAPW